MKIIALIILFPFIGFSQTKLERIKLLNDKIEISAPKELLKMTDEMWSIKYKERARPILVLSDENGEVNLLADVTTLTATEDQLASFKDSQMEQLRKSRPDLEFLGNGLKTINGKKVGYFKFLSQAIDQKVFNYYFFAIVDSKILLCSFNCVEKLRVAWENTADEIVASLMIK